MRRPPGAWCSAAPEQVGALGGLAHIVQRLRVTINGHVYDVTVEDLGSGAVTVPAPAPSAAVVRPPVPAAAVTHPPLPLAAETGPGPGAVVAPLHGVIAEVKVRVGQSVAGGDVLVILEAMKMENEIPAPEAGTVSEIRVAKGDQVAAEQILVVIG